MYNHKEKRSQSHSTHIVQNTESKSWQIASMSAKQLQILKSRIWKSFDQWHPQIALWILESWSRSSCIIMSSLSFLQTLVMHNRRDKNLSQNLFRSSLDFLIKYLLRPPGQIIFSPCLLLSAPYPL